MHIKTEQNGLATMNATHACMCESDGYKFPIAAGGFSDMSTLQHALKADNPARYSYWVEKLVD